MLTKPALPQATAKAIACIGLLHENKAFYFAAHYTTAITFNHAATPSGRKMMDFVPLSGDRLNREENIKLGEKSIITFTG